MTLRARSCPTCHSIGEPRVWAEEAGKWSDVPPQTNISDKRCTNLWHIEVREPERAGRFEELLATDHLTADPDRLAPAQQPEAVPEARAVPIEDLIEEISAVDPEFRAAVERTERGRLVPDGSKVREIPGVRLTWPDGKVEEFQCIQPGAALACVAHHREKIAAGLSGLASAELLSRKQITTPWVAVQPEPAQEETDGQR